MIEIFQRETKAEVIGEEITIKVTEIIREMDKMEEILIKEATTTVMVKQTDPDTKNPEIITDLSHTTTNPNLIIKADVHLKNNANLLNVTIPNLYKDDRNSVDLIRDLRVLRKQPLELQALKDRIHGDTINEIKVLTTNKTEARRLKPSLYRQLQNKTLIIEER